jgi:3-isopropylmalate dehydrogenase
VVEGLDIMIVRELTGGVYFGEPKTITDLGNGQKRGIDTQVYDTYEIERIARVASTWRASAATSDLDGKAQRDESGVLWNEVVTAGACARIPTCSSSISSPIPAACSW